MATYLEQYLEGKLARIGKVVLLGAGPGDPDLITVKGLKALERADVVLYDRLTNPELLKHAKSKALLLDVGKSRGECGQPRQEFIHALLIEHARNGKFVVRLKGGDPFVFGRGGEEILALREASVPYEVIPGISSAIAAASSVEIPVTHRGIATGFAVFTAQGASDGVGHVRGSLFGICRRLCFSWESRSCPTSSIDFGRLDIPKIFRLP